MASRLKFDSDRREMRRERHDARVARKRERQEAREFKHAQQHQVLRAETVGAPTDTRANAQRPAAAPKPEPRESAQTTTAHAAVTPPSWPLASATTWSDETPSMFVPQRERDVAAFMARREEMVAAARAEARERIERMGEEPAVRDALGALAHSGAAPWIRHRERLAEAISTGRIPVVGACARRACRGAASDAARTSRRAPDPELAQAVAVAYAVIGQAPWAAVRGARAERSNPTATKARRPFWR
jgi:hypothetical protein